MKKKILLLLISVLSVVAVSAQLKFGVKAGFNASTISNFPKVEIPGESGISTSTPYKPGFQIGVAAQYLITPELGIESGLYYTQIGNKYEVKVSIENEYITAGLSSNPSYLQLPITVLYKFNVGTDLYLYPQAGLYLGYGLAGKVKPTFKTNVQGVTADTEKVDFFDDDTNRFDAGLTFGLNLQYSNWVIGLGYDLGLLKINKESASGYKDIKNANIKVTLGYFF
jgi:predicted porin